MRAVEIGGLVGLAEAREIESHHVVFPRQRGQDVLPGVEGRGEAVEEDHRGAGSGADVADAVPPDVLWRELVKSEKELLSPHCPEIQGCIRCGVSIETPNPSYALPEKWKGRATLPLYEKLGARSA